MTEVYLSLGSNIGDRIGNLQKAAELINNHSEIDIVKVSSYYETEPQGYKDQDYFVNCAILCKTSLSPTDLLNVTQWIEKKLKRVKLFRWGPRTIDIDILTFGEIKMEGEELTIPHPRMYERAFVLIPLSELDPDFSKYLKDVDDQDVKLINN